MVYPGNEEYDGILEDIELITSRFLTEMLKETMLLSSQEMQNIFLLLYR
jgi:hypothetical protein